MFGIGMVVTGGRRIAVLVQGDEIIDLSQALPTLSPGQNLDGSDTLALLQKWDVALPALQVVAAAPVRVQYRLDPAGLTWLPPVQYPDKLLCAGRNYADHAREMNKGADMPPPTGNPFFFLKSVRNTLVGDGADIVIPQGAEKIDWEVELAVVIGRRTKYATVESAMAAVAGFTVMNDVSNRELQRRAEGPFPHDWLGGKCQDTFGPLGPVIVPAQFVPDWTQLRLRLTVNGALKQNCLAGEMMYGIPQQIAFLSSVLTLEPGDILATGTPSGVGAGRGEFLQPGDVVVTEVEGIGRLTNYCVAD